MLAKSDVSTELSNGSRQTEVYNYWLDKWLANKKSVVKEFTFIRYRNLIENHIKPNLGKLNITEINNRCIQQYISRKSIDGRIDGCGGLSPKTLPDTLPKPPHTRPHLQIHRDTACQNQV
uniref:N-terminal phage integrase SAM-like domain-containing protein n=1 Tax=Ruminococcus bromii TaxID=40518 RepID=UPI004029B3ED